MWCDVLPIAWHVLSAALCTFFAQRPHTYRNRTTERTPVCTISPCVEEVISEKECSVLCAVCEADVAACRPQIVHIQTYIRNGAHTKTEQQQFMPAANVVSSRTQRLAISTPHQSEIRGGGEVVLGRNGASTRSVNKNYARLQ